MKSSHSGTPILSPDVAVLVVVLVVLLELLVVELLLLIVSVLLHPISTNAHNTQKAKKVLVIIWELLDGFGGTCLPHSRNGIEKRGDHTREDNILVVSIVVGSVLD